MTHTCTDTITLKAMQFYALVGILPHETKVPQPIEIDLTVCVDREMSGRIVDYTMLYNLAAASVNNRHTEYLETIADTVATGALEIDGVMRARVAVRKPHVALGGPIAYAEVTAERERSAQRDYTG